MHWPVGSLTSRPSLAHARQWRGCSTSVMAPVCRFILCNRCIRPWPARRPDLFVLTEPVFYGRFPQGGVRRMERVFITGASSGIDAARAVLYARRGASVALVGRGLEPLEAVAA